MATVFESSTLTTRARAIDARIHEMQDKGQLQRLHCAVLKDIGPSCVNRDMSGEQKTIIYGDVPRMFISSHAIWQGPRQDELKDAFRTRRIALYMNNRLRKDIPGYSDEWYAYAASTASPSKDSAKDAEEKKEPLATYSEADIEEMVSIIKENFQPSSEKKEDLEKEAKRVQGIMQKAMKETAMERAVNVNIASFGRMSTDERFKTIYGSMYRSHAISVGKYNHDVNDYAATDQYITYLNKLGLSSENNVGMLETSDCNSGLLLFQFIDDPAIFIRNILRGQDINDEAVWEKAIKVCNETQAKRISQLVNYIPSGKQHSYATNPLPILAVCTFTNGMAHTLEGAFADPVTGDGASFEENAVNRLVDYLDDDTFYDAENDRLTRYWVAAKRFNNAPKDAKRVNLKEMLSLIKEGAAYAHD